MKTTTQKDYEERILRVLVHIQNSLDSELDLDELAGIAAFSPFHFHRVFRGMTGEPVREHVRRLRLERAAYHLKCSERPVTQLAFEAGFETHESFTRAFKAMFGESPSVFREERRVGPAPNAPSGVHYAPDGTLVAFSLVDTGDVTMDVRIEEVGKITAAFIRHTGPYMQVGETWGKLCAFAGRKGLFGPNTTMFGVCHDDPEVTPADKIRYDACITVDDGFQGEGEVGVQQAGGGRYAITTHKGPYEKLHETYVGLIGQWLPANGLEPAAGPSLEFYRNDPNTTAPADLITEVYVPLKS